MTVIEQMRYADQLCMRLRSATCSVGPRERQRAIRGVDPNELKKVYAFLLKHRDMNLLRKLVDSLPKANFAYRSGSTYGYFKNIQATLDAGFYRLGVEDAIYILGWTCRLL